MPRDDWKRLVAEAEGLVAEHGDVFRGDYGWAHGQLMATSPEYAAQVERGARQRGPMYEDLERVVGGRRGDPRRWQPLYGAANAAVHGAPMASVSFHAQRKAIRRRGPYLEPMWEPGEATAHRLADLGWAFCLPDYGVLDEDPYVGFHEKISYAISELAEMAERSFATAREQS